MAVAHASTADLHGAFEVAERWLSLNRDALNAINVYPVPDGDTGTNMLLTLRAALQGGAGHTDGAVSAYLAALARGALLGARGNSGVILSQMLRGLAEALDGSDDVAPDALCRALTSAARTAYSAVSNPVEGTMLTVMREAAEATDGGANGHRLHEVLRIAADAAHASVERTPDLMPMLRDAGVVDAGGMGVAVILTGLCHGLSGEPLPDPPEAPTAQLDLSALEHEGYGYCTEFLIEGASIDRAALEATLIGAGGESTLVVGDASAVHVHVHIADPGIAISAGAAAGALSGVKVENMQAQHEAWTEDREADLGDEDDDGDDDGAADLPAVGLVAVAQGRGLVRAFRELGARRVVSGEAKPSAGELLEAARRAGRDHVFLLPNDKDVLMAARQAAEQADPPITVIPTRSVATGLAAAIAYMPDGDPEDIEAQMNEVLADVRAVEVTHSVRTAVVDGIEVEEGDAIALLDGTLVARGETLDEALLAALALAATPATSLVTLYLGAGATEDDGARVAALIEEAHDGIAVEVIEGGQPYYPFVVGVE